MIIRAAEDRDLNGILILLAGMDDEEVMDIDTARAVSEKIMQYPDYKIYVVEDKDRLIATFSMIIIDNLGHNGSKFAVVEGVVVEKKHRGAGIGHMMMNFAMERAREAKCYKIMLSSNKKRVKAHKFYSNLGYKQHGISFMTEVK